MSSSQNFFFPPLFSLELIMLNLIIFLDINVYKAESVRRLREYDPLCNMELER